MKDKNAQRGGKRAGAGRKPSEAGPLVQVTYRVTKEQKAQAAQLGGAEWLRQVIDQTVAMTGEPPVCRVCGKPMYSGFIQPTICPSCRTTPSE